MNKALLLGTAGLAVSLLAAPVYAQHAADGAGVGTNALNNPSSYGNGGNYGANQGGPYAVSGGGGVRLAQNNAGVGAGAGDNNASTGGGAGTVGTVGPATTGTAAGIGTMTPGETGGIVGNGHYANVGFGSYTGEQFFIRNNNNNNNNTNNGNNNNWRPSQRNSVLADNGDARASKVVGTAVYNELNQKLGNVNDVLIGTNGVFAVIATNNKQVAVPFGDLMFGNATNQGDEKIVIPNETEARLNTLPVFHYNVTNYPGVNANNFGANNFSGGANGGVYAAGSGVNSGVGSNGVGVGANVGGVGAGIGGNPNSTGVGVGTNVGVGGNAGAGGAGVGAGAGTR